MTHHKTSEYQTERGSRGRGRGVRGGRGRAGFNGEEKYVENVEIEETK